MMQTTDENNRGNSKAKPGAIEPRDQVLSQKLGDEAVLLDLDNEAYFGLDEVGARIWELLQQGATRQTLLDTLLQEYEVEMAQLETDLDAFLAKLDEAGLITRAENPPKT